MSTNYAELTRSFEDCDIDASAFGHIDHIGVAYEMLRRNDFLTAALKYAKCIDRIAKKAGAARKFNTTITLAFLSLIAERMQTTSNDSFDAFIAQNQDLVSGNPLQEWYSPERLQSDMARSLFLMPDIIAYKA